MAATITLTTNTPITTNALDMLKAYVIEDGMTAEDIVHVLLDAIACASCFPSGTIDDGHIDMPCYIRIEDRKRMTALLDAEADLERRLQRLRDANVPDYTSMAESYLEGRLTEVRRSIALEGQQYAIVNRVDG